MKLELLEPGKTPMAFIVVVPEIVIVPVYNVLDAVGVDPSVV